MKITADNFSGIKLCFIIFFTVITSVCSFAFNSTCSSPVKICNKKNKKKHVGRQTYITLKIELSAI